MYPIAKMTYACTIGFAQEFTIAQSVTERIEQTHV
jgi:hypothetical protein